MKWIISVYNYIKLKGRFIHFNLYHIVQNNPVTASMNRWVWANGQCWKIQHKSGWRMTDRQRRLLKPSLTLRRADSFCLCACLDCDQDWPCCLIEVMPLPAVPLTQWMKLRFLIGSVFCKNLSTHPCIHQCVRFVNLSFSAMVTDARCGNDVFSSRAGYAVSRRSLILPAWLKFSCRPQSHICACTALTYRIYFRCAFPLGCSHILFKPGLCKTLDNAEIIYKQLCKSSGGLILEMMRW